MKSKGKIRQLIDPATGKPLWSEHPMTLVEAVREDVAKYWPLTPCPVHGGRPVYFRVVDKPGCCVHDLAVKAYNEAVIKGEPTSILQAQQMGVDYYWSGGMANNVCGHPSKILFNGKCAFCRELKESSPRQVAIREGSAWYMPLDTDPCKNGHVALRRVNNGSCKQCEEEEVAAKSKSNPQIAAPVQELPINKLCPDLVMDRESARALGYKVYRTGKACHNGHLGWRYVSTCACIDCLG